MKWWDQMPWSSLQRNVTNLQKQIHRLCEWAYSCWWEGWGRGIVREFGMDMYTLLYLKWITDRDLLYSTWNSAQCFVAVWVGGVWGEWIHVYVWVGLFAVRLKLSQPCLLISYTSIQNKKLKNKYPNQKWHKTTYQNDICTLMFIATLFVIAYVLKQFNGPLTYK